MRKSLAGQGNSSESKIPEEERCLDLALDVAFVLVLPLIMVWIRLSSFRPLYHVCELISKMLRFYVREDHAFLTSLYPGSSLVFGSC